MHNGAHKLLLIVVNQIIGLPSLSNEILMLPPPPVKIHFGKVLN